MLLYRVKQRLRLGNILDVAQRIVRLHSSPYS
jgi:hypothetical protein